MATSASTELLAVVVILKLTILWNLFQNYHMMQTWELVTITTLILIVDPILLILLLALDTVVWTLTQLLEMTQAEALMLAALLCIICDHIIILAIINRVLWEKSSLQYWCHISDKLISLRDECRLLHTYSFFSTGVNLQSWSLHLQWLESSFFSVLSHQW